MESSPASNRLSDAPSAAGSLSREESRFFEELAPRNLYAVFQPIVDLGTGAPFAYEALVRCRLPGFSPEVLFERAAALRTTGRLGRMIREIAIPLCGGVPLFVNLHPNEMAERWLVRPDDPIFSHDTDVYLEITESAPITHFELCASVLREVCGRTGVHLVVDDLGAGYSNLKIIADLEPKIVKLDRKLVQDLHKKKRQQTLVSTIVRLCSELGAAVVAEGIETEDEFRAVCDSGAQYGQGFLFARPGFPLPTVSWPAPIHATLHPPHRATAPLRPNEGGAHDPAPRATDPAPRATEPPPRPAADVTAARRVVGPLAYRPTEPAVAGPSGSPRGSGSVP